MLARLARTLWLILLPMVVWAGPAPTQYTLKVTLDYDFTTNHGCKAKDNSRCVGQFNIYDITDAAKPVRLFSILVPRGTKKLVKGIKGTSGLLTLDAGVHTFGATALMIDGAESSPQACTVTVTVGATSQMSLNMTAK